MKAPLIVILLTCLILWSLGNNKFKKFDIQGSIWPVHIFDIRNENIGQSKIVCAGLCQSMGDECDMFHLGSQGCHLGKTSVSNHSVLQPQLGIQSVYINEGIHLYTTNFLHVSTSNYI